MQIGLAGILAAACSILHAFAASTEQSHQLFIDLAAKNAGVVPLDPGLFEKITANSREWSVSVQFTAMSPTMKCAPCRDFAPQFATVAKAWSKVPAEQRNQHFFAILDFADAADTFRRLQLVSAPVMQYYPAARGPRRPTNGKLDPQPWDFNSFGFDAETMAEELSKYTPVKIPYKPPVNWALITTAVSGVFAFLLALRFIIPILTSRWIWALLITVACVVFTSGIMFVRIRASPWTGNGKNGPSWIAGGYQNMYGMEVQVLAGIYGTLAFSYCALIFLVPRILSPYKQRLAIYIWCTVIFLLFSVLLSLFGLKNQAYPFRLLL